MNTKYTDVNVYWLTWGGANGRRMAAMDGSPSGSAPVPVRFLATQHLEEDHRYISNYPSGPDGNRWYWSYILAIGSPASTSYSFALRHVATGPLNANVRGVFKGYTTNQHHTRVYINGYLIDDATWYSQETYTFDVNIPQSYLVEGTNTLTVEALLDSGIPHDVFLVNWFEIDYHRTYFAEDDQLFFQGDDPGTREFRLGSFTAEAISVFDITSPANPSRITNGLVSTDGDGYYSLALEQADATERYYVALTDSQSGRPLSIERDQPSDLTSAINGADYVIITHGDFYTAMLPLAAHRADQGMRAMVVDVQDIYDEFSYGVFEPEAIRDFLTYAYVNWAEPAPAYVVLVGDGNYDFKNNLGTGEPNYIPPYLAPIDHWIGEVAADNRYVCVSGDDIFPDMHLGRLPVKTSAEAAAVVAKIIDYEQNPASGDWNRRLLFVTDNPDSAGYFYGYSDAIADRYVPVPYTAQKIYYGFTHSSASAARAAITDAINEGQLIVNYVGHGSIQSWASERLFGLNRIPALSNGERLPLMVAMACLDGHYTLPSRPGSDRSSTAEAVIRAPEKGAIASWSATGLGLASAHDYLNKGLFEAIFSNDVIELGPATTQGKLYLYSRTGGYRDQIDQYTLFGDPALRLNVPPSDVGIAQTVEPSGSLRSGDTITFTLTYFNAGPASAHHVIISDELPPALQDAKVASAGASVTLREGSRFVWDVAALAAGEGGVITVTASISRWFAGPLANTATIATTTPESDAANNTATVLADVDEPDFPVIPVEAGLDQSAFEGESVSFSGSFDDGGRPEAHTFVWDFGDGRTTTGTLNPAHTYADDGTYTVTLTVAGDYGWQGSDTSIVTISNVAPVVSAQATPPLTYPRQQVAFRVTIADPGSFDTHAIRWDFGDGTSATGGLMTTHTYSSGGVYTATVSVTDDDGGIGHAVVPVAVYYDLHPVAIHVDTVAAAEVGQELEVRNGIRAGQFGWLTWTGDQSVETLVRSLVLPGDSESYVNPDDSSDSVLSPGDWVYGVRRTKNSQALDDALNALKGTTIIVPVWDQVERKGRGLKYHIVGFTRLEVVTHSLRGWDGISIVLEGYVPCPD
jgi:PKD repeat protein